MKLATLMSTTFVKNNWSENQNIDITAITQYIEEVTTGTLFLCIKSIYYDGHDFIQQALDQGASAIITERLPALPGPFLLVSNTNKAMAQVANQFYDYPSSSMRVFGVTGTNGKTTTTFLIDCILKEAGIHSGLIGTLYNKIGNQHFPTPNTTPHTVQLQALLAKMAQAEVTDCVLEVSSHGLKQDRVLGIDFTVAVFTNFTQDHLDFHDSMEDYLQSKLSLFSGLGNQLTPSPKAAVVNIDDPYGQLFVDATPANVYTYGIGQGDIQATHVQSTASGTQFTLTVVGHSYTVKTHLVGKFNVYNILAAFGACYAVGIAPETIISAIESIETIKGRFQSVANTHGITAIVDYAHTPDGLLNVLSVARSLTTGKLYCVVGCGGDRDISKRPIMAKIATDHADFAFFTTDNPRSEKPEAIVAHMTEPLIQHNYAIELNRQLAIEKALAKAQTGDIVLVAGMGHETYYLPSAPEVEVDDVQLIDAYLGQLSTN